MKNVVFNTPAQLSWQGERVSPSRFEASEISDWTLGEAILFVIHQSSDLQDQFEIETEDSRLDHLAIQRLAESSIFQRWRQTRA